MRRIKLVAAVVAAMVVMLAASATPAFAKSPNSTESVPCDNDTEFFDFPGFEGKITGKQQDGGFRTHFNCRGELD